MACIRLIYLQTCDITGAIAPYAARNFAHLSVVSCRQRSYGQRRCEEYWLILLSVVNQVCPGWPFGNEGGFRLVVPKKGSDKSLVLFCVSCGCYAFARNMRGLFWLGCAIRKCESVYSGSIINLKCHSSKNVL